MHKISLLSLIAVFLFLPFASTAQSPDTVYSPYFAMPENNLFTPKLVQASNGNTLLISIAKNEGVTVSVYNNAHKLIATEKTGGEIWNDEHMKAFSIQGIYEINGNISMFVQQEFHGTPGLYRIDIDPSTGKKIAEEKVGEMIRYRAGDGFGIGRRGDNPFQKKFFVEKDPASDCYAIVSFDPTARKEEYRIECVHYDGRHTVINKTVYTSTEDKYQDYLCMWVDGNRQVLLCTYDYSTRSKGGKSYQVVLSRLRKADTTPEKRVLKSEENLKKVTACMVYNPGIKSLQLLIMTQEEQRNNGYINTITYSALFKMISPETLIVTQTKLLPAGQLSHYKQSVLDEQSAFGGVPRGLFVNPDNTTSVAVMEVLKTKNVTHIDASTIGAVQLDNMINEKGAVLFRTNADKRYAPAVPGCDEETAPLFMLNDVANGKSAVSADFGYLFTKSGNQYFFYNDNAANFNLADNDTKGFVRNRFAREPLPAVPFCIKTGGNKIQKTLLGSSNPDTDINSIALFNSASFNVEKSEYAVLIQETGNKKSSARILWITLD